MRGDSWKKDPIPSQMSTSTYPEVDTIDFSSLAPRVPARGSRAKMSRGIQRALCVAHEGATHSNKKSHPA